MEKHGNITIDFSIYGIAKQDLRIPFHMPVKDIIADLVEIFGLQELQEQLHCQSFRAQISQKFIPGSKTLLEENIKEGEVLTILK